MISQNHPFRVVIAGGSFAGLSAAGNLLDLCNGRPARFAQQAVSKTSHGKVNVEIIIVDERDGYYHILGTPLALVDTEYSSKIWIEYSEMTGLQDPTVQFVQGTVAAIDTEACEATIVRTGCAESTLKYDFFIAATGLRRVSPIAPESLDKTAYLAEIQGHAQQIRTAEDGVVITGGGAIGVEVAAEIRHIHPNIGVTLIHSRGNLLSSEPLPDEFKAKALELLRDDGVKVILNKRAKQTKERVVEFEDGDDPLAAGYIIQAISSAVPSTAYLPAQALCQDGHVLVTPTSDRHFAVGDIASFDGIKRCSSAMQMGYIAAVNIHQQLLTIAFPAIGLQPARMHFEGVPRVFRFAMGRQAIFWNPEDGVVFGEKPLQDVFGDDLSWKKCCDYMGLI